MGVEKVNSVQNKYMKLHIITTLLIFLIAISGVGITVAEVNAYEPKEYFPDRGDLLEYLAEIVCNNEIDFSSLIAQDYTRIDKKSITYGELSYLLEGITKEKFPEKVRLKYNSLTINEVEKNIISATIKITVNVNTRALTARLLGIKKEYLPCEASFTLDKEGKIGSLEVICDGNSVSPFFMEMASMYAFGNKAYKSEIKAFFDVIIATFGNVQGFTEKGILFD